MTSAMCAGLPFAGVHGAARGWRGLCGGRVVRFPSADFLGVKGGRREGGRGERGERREERGERDRRQKTERQEKVESIEKEL